MNRAYFATDAIQVYCMSGPRLEGLAPAGLPDWEDAPKTMNDPEPFAMEAVQTVRAPVTYPPAYPPPADIEPETVARPASYVRELSPDVTAPMATADASQFLDTMGELQLNLQMTLLCLGDSVDGIPYDRSAHAAAETLRTRIQEIGDLRDALNELYLDAADPSVALLFRADAPLVSYIKGIYLWCNEVTNALADLANALRVLQPDWFALRQRIERASMWYFDGLPNEIRPEIERLGVRADLAAKIEEVFFAARFLAHGLEKRFG